MSISPFKLVRCLMWAKKKRTRTITFIRKDISTDRHTIRVGNKCYLIKGIFTKKYRDLSLMGAKIITFPLKYLRQAEGHLEF